MKIKIPDSLLSKTSHLSVDGETSASITLSDGQTVTDVKILGRDYLLVTYKTDIEGVDIKDIVLSVPSVDAQNVAKDNLGLSILIDEVKGLMLKMEKYLELSKAPKDTVNVSVDPKILVAPKPGL